MNVGDIRDVIEMALGGKAITTTVEGRERFPVRVRYARAFREDEEDVKNLLISAATAPMGPKRQHGRWKPPEHQPASRSTACRSRWRWSPT